MTSVRLTAAAVLSLMLASPAMGMHHNSHRYGPIYYRYGQRLHLPVVDALHFGYGRGVCGFHSGFGGLYRDGYYPGNVCSDGGSHLIY